MKKFLLLPLFIFCIGLYVSNSSIVNAVEMVHVDYNKSTIDVWDYLIENYFATVGDITDASNFNYSGSYSNSYANFQALENLIYSTDYVVFYNRSSSYVNNLYVALSDSDIVFYSGSTSVTGSAKKKSLTTTLSIYDGKYAVPNSGINNNWVLSNSDKSISSIDTTGFCLAYTPNGWYELRDGSITTDDIIIQPKFDPNGDELSYQQWGNRINNITTSYLSNTTNLGVWVEGFENGSDYLYNLVEIRPASSGYDYQVTGLVATNQNYIHISNDYHYVSVPTRILNYGKFYVLSISYYVGSTLTNNNYFYYINGSALNGELTLFSGDPYMTTNEQTNSIINNQKSGDNWWRDTYNNLFTLNSGDVADIYNSVSNALSSGDTLIVAYQPIQDLLEAEPSDFVIRWGNIPVVLSINNGEQLTNGNLITSGEINFSKMARDNSTLSTIKFWVNTLISFSLFYLCLFEIYKIILYILGQTPSLVEAVTSDEESTTETIIDTDYYNHSDSVSKVVRGVRHTDSAGHNTTKTTTRRRKL